MKGWTEAHTSHRTNAKPQSGSDVPPQVLRGLEVSNQAKEAKPPPDRRYYPASKSVDGHGSARLIGYPESEWPRIAAALQELGFKPY